MTNIPALHTYDDMTDAELIEYHARHLAKLRRKSRTASRTSRTGRALREDARNEIETIRMECPKALPAIIARCKVLAT